MPPQNFDTGAISPVQFEVLGAIAATQKSGLVPDNPDQPGYTLEMKW